MKGQSKLIHGLIVFACSGLLVLPVSVKAFVVQYNDLADFSLGTIVTNNFESGVRDFAEFGFDSTSAIVSSAGSTSGVTSSGTHVLVEDRSSAPLNVQLTVDAQEVGFYFGNDDPGFGGFNALLNIYDATDNLLGGVSLNTNNNDYADQFLGLYSDDPFRRVEILYTNEVASLAIDDFSIGRKGINVAEPGSILLIGIGLIGLISVARIRQAETGCKLKA